MYFWDILPNNIQTFFWPKKTAKNFQTLQMQVFARKIIKIYDLGDQNR